MEHVRSLVGRGLRDAEDNLKYLGQQRDLAVDEVARYERQIADTEHRIAEYRKFLAQNDF